MCGRFSQSQPARDYARLLGVERAAEGILQRWNVAPGLAVAMFAEEDVRALGLWHWGFVPHWARDLATLKRPVNARVESLAGKPMFRDAWRRGQRGLVPVDGFYEWRLEEGRKQPWFIHRRDGEPMLLASLWDRRERPGQAPWQSFAILVGPANELVAPLHDRMPIIIPRSDADRWLSRATPPAQLSGLLEPCPAAALEAYRVSPRVNNAACEGPELVLPW